MTATFSKSLLPILGFLSLSLTGFSAETGAIETSDGGRLFFSPSLVRVLTITPNQEAVGGSGVVVSEEGLILTSSTNITVGPGLSYQVVSSGRGMALKAELLGVDRKTGVAALRVEAGKLTPVKKADKDSMIEGEAVSAVGLDSNLFHLISAGKIIAVQQMDLGLIPGGYEKFIQTDVPVDPDRNGGPLLNLKGEWLGLNYFANREGNALAAQESGVAIPADMALDIAEKLIKNEGEVKRGFLGVFLKALPAEIAAQFGLEEGLGVMVVEVGEDTPAKASGMKSGDVILEVDGKPVTGMQQLRFDISNKVPGSEVVFQILQDGVKSRILVELGELQPKPEAGVMRKAEE